MEKKADRVNYPDQNRKAKPKHIVYATKTLEGFVKLRISKDGIVDILDTLNQVYDNTHIFTYYL